MQRLAPGEGDLVAGRGSAFVRELIDDEVDSFSGPRRLVNDLRRQRLSLEAGTGGGERPSDGVGDLDLVRLAGREGRGLRSGEHLAAEELHLHGVLAAAVVA